MRSHSGEKPHACTLCSKAFVERGNLKRHMKMNHPNAPMPPPPVPHPIIPAGVLATVKQEIKPVISELSKYTERFNGIFCDFKFQRFVERQKRSNNSNALTFS